MYFPTRIFKFNKRNFYQYLYSQSVNINFPNGLTDNNNSLKKLSSVICDLLMSLSVIILLMDLLTAKIR